MLKAFAEQWALVTGASTGIGAEFARQLAGRGMHLVLTARRQDLLEKLAAELHTAHGTRTEIIACDLSRPGAPQELAGEIARRGCTVELLVNNAGFSVIGPTEAGSRERVLQMLDLNTRALTDLTYLYLPEMMQRGHGGILNVASTAAFQPVAFMSAYAATKAYVLHFTEGLWAEARAKGVTLTALCPGITKTDFWDVAGKSEVPGERGAEGVHAVVRNGIRALERKRQFVVSGWKNYMLACLVRFAPRWLVALESRKVFQPKT